MGRDADERSGMEDEARRKAEENTLAVRMVVYVPFPCAGRGVVVVVVAVGFFCGSGSLLSWSVKGGWFVILGTG
jgi:hypothetical protein